VVFVAIESTGDLELIGSLQHEIARDGAIWTIRRRPRRPHRGDGDRSRQGRRPDRHQDRRISDTHTGMKS